MGLGNIIEGHFYEVFKMKSELAKKRLEICKKCRIYKPDFGGICNGFLYINPELKDAIPAYKDNKLVEAPEGYFKGCFCRLQAKTRIPDEACPAGQW